MRDGALLVGAHALQSSAEVFDRAEPELSDEFRVQAEPFPNDLVHFLVHSCDAGSRLPHLNEYCSGSRRQLQHGALELFLVFVRWRRKQHHQCVVEAIGHGSLRGSSTSLARRLRRIEQTCGGGDQLEYSMNWVGHVVWGRVPIGLDVVGDERAHTKGGLTAMSANSPTVIAGDISEKCVEIEEHLHMTNVFHRDSLRGVPMLLLTIINDSS